MSNQRLLWPFAFFICATGARLLLQHSIDTRYQILACWCLALLIEAGLAKWGAGRDLCRMYGNGVAATCAMVIVRYMLEGIPEKITHWFGAGH